MVSKKIKPLCRRQQVQQVVMNLVTNARDALNVTACERERLKKIQRKSPWGGRYKRRSVCEIL
jgi:signal transduction histidine kinase